MGIVCRTGTKLLALAALLLVAGCAGHRYWVGRYVRDGLARYAREVPVTQCKARVHMAQLEVWVDARSGEQAYRSDFQLEERYVAQVCLAVARSEVVFDQQWTVMDLEVWNRYGKGLHWSIHSGLYVITMARADMERLRSGAVMPEAVPHLWTRKLGVKQGPDHEVIEWPADAAEPLRRTGK